MKQSAVFLFAALVVVSAALGPVGRAAPRAALRANLSAAGPSVPASHSRGFPWRGRLEHGARLEESDALRYVEAYRQGDHFFGTHALVEMLGRASRDVQRRYPGAPLSVGELSAQAGGRLPEHHSHQSGRDVDVGFYAKWKETGESALADDFVRFWATGDGAGRDRDKTFDDARNWAFVRALLEERQARVQFVFVSNTLRRRLLRQGFRDGASEPLLSRAATVLRAPSGRHPHKNHFHVRIYCPKDDKPACKERGPYWEWYDGEPPWGLTTPSRRPPWLREGRMPR